jgi:hypothetical protein
MNYKNLSSAVMYAHAMRDRQKIRDIYMDLINEKSRLDRWFNKYLDMFDNKMNSSNRKDPVWKLYHAKAEEYSNLSSAVRTAEYYLKQS